MKILAVGSPKGGVGKTTIAVSLADVFARSGLRVVVIDADDNASASFWLSRAEDSIAVDYDRAGTRTLRQLSAIPGYDLMLVDLPGSARAGGELRALLTGDDGRPVVDFFLLITELGDLDLHAVAEVTPTIIKQQIPYLVVFSKVSPRGTEGAVRAQNDYSQIWNVANTRIRAFTAHKDAPAYYRSILTMPGRSGPRREAEQDMRLLAREVATYLNLNITIFDAPPTPSPTPRQSNTSQTTGDR